MACISIIFIIIFSLLNTSFLVISLPTSCLISCFIVSEEGEECELTPVSLFNFIINPNSFGQTIENLFHLSFLVRVSCTLNLKCY